MRMLAGLLVSVGTTTLNPSLATGAPPITDQRQGALRQHGGGNASSMCATCLALSAFADTSYKPVKCPPNAMGQRRMPAPPPTQTRLSAMKLLVIEDDRETTAYLVKGLGESGYTVDHAADGRDGLFL